MARDALFRKHLSSLQKVRVRPITIVLGPSDQLFNPPIDNRVPLGKVSLLHICDDTRPIGVTPVIASLETLNSARTDRAARYVLLLARPTRR